MALLWTRQLHSQNGWNYWRRPTRWALPALSGSGGSTFFGPAKAPPLRGSIQLMDSWNTSQRIARG